MPCFLLSMPNELLARVIVLHVHDMATLQSCSLVCSALCATAQPYLFNKITLEIDQVKSDSSDNLAVSCSNSEHFSILLDSAPHLARHVRHLGICSAAFLSTALPSILASLTNVTSLYLFATHAPGAATRKDVNWTQMSPLMRAFSTNIFPTIESLELEVFDIPLSVIGQCPRLTKITNFFSRFLAGPSILPYHNSSRALQKLSLSCGSLQIHLPILTDFILSHNCEITSLDIELHCGFQPADIMCIGELLSTCRETLSSLEVVTLNDPTCVKSKFAVLDAFFCISQFPALKSLTITLRVWQSFDGQLEIQIPEIAWLVERCNSFTGACSLEQIIIEVWIECDKAPSFSLFGADLDRTLLGARLPYLRTLAIRCSAQESPYFENVVDIFRHALPLATSRGLLTCQDRF